MLHTGRKFCIFRRAFFMEWIQKTFWLLKVGEKGKLDKIDRNKGAIRKFW